MINLKKDRNILLNFLGEFPFSVISVKGFCKHFSDTRASCLCFFMKSVIMMSVGKPSQFVT